MACAASPSSADPAARVPRRGSGRCRAARPGCAGSPRRASAPAARRRGSRGGSAARSPPDCSSAAKLPGPPFGQNSVHVNERSGFGRAIIIDVPRGQMCSAPGSSANSPSRLCARDVQLLVAVVEEVEVLVERPGTEQLAAHGRTGAVGAEHDVGVRQRLAATASRTSSTSVARVQVDVDQPVVERGPPRPAPPRRRRAGRVLSAALLIELIARSPSALYGWKSSGRRPGGSSGRASAGRRPSPRRRGRSGAARRGRARRSPG